MALMYLAAMAGFTGQTFSISESPGEDGTVIVAVRGELDVSVADQLAEVIRRNLSGGLRQILDLSELTFIDSTGLASIVKGPGSDEERARLRIRLSRHPQPLRLFKLTGADRLFAADDDGLSDSERAQLVDELPA